MQRRSIVVFDDDVECRSLLERYIESAGHRTEVVTRAADLAGHLDQTRHAAAIAALSTGQAERLRLVTEIVRLAPTIPLLVVVDHDEAEEAVEAMRAGAFGHIGKPYLADQVTLVVHKALEQRRLREEVRDLRSKAHVVERPIICKSEAMRRLIEAVDRMARSEASVLILGESGTGKELVARRIQARSPRAGGPFVPVSCAALPAGLLEAELFGHAKGAYTGADGERLGRLRAAEAGTLFLDEIAELPLPLQGKLLRVLQERTVDVLGSDEPVPFDARILAATNRDMRRLVAAGAFRDDLFYRLNVIEIHVPSLDERRDDIPLLARHFFQQAAKGRDVTLPGEVLAALVRRAWPGNVRELQNTCKRLAILARGRRVRLTDLPAAPRARASTRGPQEVPLPLDEQEIVLPPEGFSLVELERRVMLRVLERTGWNISHAARFLQVPRHILTYRMRKYGLRRSEAITPAS